MKRILLATVGGRPSSRCSPRRSGSAQPRADERGRPHAPAATATLPPLPANISQRKRFIIGVKCDAPPFGYIDVQGKNAGFDVEIAKWFARYAFGATTASRSSARRPPRASRCSRPAASTS